MTEKVLIVTHDNMMEAIKLINKFVYPEMVTISLIEEGQLTVDGDLAISGIRSDHEIWLAVSLDEELQPEIFTIDLDNQWMSVHINDQKLVVRVGSGQEEKMTFILLHHDMESFGILPRLIRFVLPQNLIMAVYDQGERMLMGRLSIAGKTTETNRIWLSVATQDCGPDFIQLSLDRAELVHKRADNSMRLSWENGYNLNCSAIFQLDEEE